MCPPFLARAFLRAHEDRGANTRRDQHAAIRSCASRERGTHCLPRGPEDLARNLVDALGKFLHFDQLFLLVLKENSKEIESAALANGQLTLPDIPLEDLPSRQAFDRQVLLYIPDWSTEERFPRLGTAMRPTVNTSRSVCVRGDQPAIETPNLPGWCTVASRAGERPSAWTRQSRMPL
jgi:hypothetical protein